MKNTFTKLALTILLGLGLCQTAQAFISVRRGGWHYRPRRSHGRYWWRKSPVRLYGIRYTYGEPYTQRYYARLVDKLLEEIDELKEKIAQLEERLEDR